MELDEKVTLDVIFRRRSIRRYNVVYFGYLDEDKKPGTKYNKNAVYWQKYDPDRERNLRTIEMKYD